MRVGLFSDTYTPEINGVVSSVVLHQKELEKHGHEVFVITTNNNLFESERQGNVLRLPGIEIKKMYGYIASSPLHFSAYSDIEEMNLDLIHAHTEFGIGIFARLVARKFNIPLVSTYHTTYEDYTHYVNLVNSKSIDRVAKKVVANLSRIYGMSCVEMIAPSHKTKEMLLGYKVKTPIEVIPTGIDLQRFHKSKTTQEQIVAIRKEAGVQEDELLIVFIGRIAPEKSIDIPIRAMKILKERQVKARLMIVGSGPQLDELKDLAKSLGCEDKIAFLGKKLATEVPAYYHASDIFVSASLTETQGLTYIEALAAELPVFARADEILSEIVLDRQTGYYFEDDDSLADCVMEHLSLSKQDIKVMKAQCVNQVKVYDSEIFYQNIITLYQRVVELYNYFYEVTMIKTKSDYTEIIVENKEETLKIKIDFKNHVSENIRLGSKLSSESIKYLQEKEAVVNAYIACIKKLAIKDYSRKEMYDFLTQKTDLDISDINDIIESLEEKEYIDDLRFTKEKILKCKGMLQGENKIFRTLKKHGIAVEMIEEVLALSKDEESELQNAIKAAEKFQNSIQEISLRKKKQKIYQKLFNQGFNNDMIEQALNHLNYQDEEENELDNLRKIANKAKKRYAHQNDGVQLRNLVFRYCSSQGFDLEDNYIVLREMEWSNE